MLKPRVNSVSRLVALSCEYTYRLECVEAKWVGVNVTDHEPSLDGVVVPRSRADGASRSPLIHTSRRSMFGASLVEPVIVKSDLVDTFAFSVGALTVTTGAAPPDGAEGAGA